MSLRLIACPSCSNYVKETEPHCVCCGARIRSESGVVGRTAGAVLMGLSLTACPTDDTTGDSQAGTESTTQPGTDTSSSTTMSESMSSTTAPATDTSTLTDPGSDSSTFSGESAYGVPQTGTTIEETGPGTDTDTDTDTDTSGETNTTAAETGSTSVSPDYGLPD